MPLHMEVRLSPGEPLGAGLMMSLCWLYPSRTGNCLQWFMFSVIWKHKNEQGGILQTDFRSITAHTHTLLNMCAWLVHDKSSDNIFNSAQQHKNESLRFHVAVISSGNLLMLIDSDSTDFLCTQTWCGITAHRYALSHLFVTFFSQHWKHCQGNILTLDVSNVLKVCKWRLSRNTNVALICWIDTIYVMTLSCWQNSV